MKSLNDDEDRLLKRKENRRIGLAAKRVGCEKQMEMKQRMTAHKMRLQADRQRHTKTYRDRQRQTKTDRQTYKIAKGREDNEQTQAETERLRQTYRRSERGKDRARYTCGPTDRKMKTG